jgi:hypothetical protein
MTKLTQCSDQGAAEQFAADMRALGSTVEVYSAQATNGATQTWYVWITFPH